MNPTLTEIHAITEELVRLMREKEVERPKATFWVDDNRQVTIGFGNDYAFGNIDDVNAVINRAKAGIAKLTTAADRRREAQAKAIAAAIEATEAVGLDLMNDAEAARINDIVLKGLRFTMKKLSENAIEVSAP